MSDNIYSSQFRSELKAATRQSRIDLGDKFSLNANRGKAYYNIATVLRNEASRIRQAWFDSVPIGPVTAQYINSDSYRAELRLFEAAKTLETQAEITTYSGEAGEAAKEGNYNALINNRGIYNTPLDLYSWQIDDAIVSYFTNVADIGGIIDFNEISTNSILGVDGLIWHGKGLINYFPGTGFGFSYSELSANSLVWSVAQVGQKDKLKDRSFGAGDFIQNGGFLVAGAYGSDLTRSLGKYATNYGFPDEIEALANGQLNDDGTLIVEIDEFGRRIIRENVDNGNYILLENEFSSLGFWDRIGSAAASGVVGPLLLSDAISGDFISSPDGPTIWVASGWKNIDGTHGIDYINDLLGADFGKRGLRVRHNDASSDFYDPDATTDISVQEYINRFESANGVSSSYSVPSVIEQPNGDVLIGNTIFINEGGNRVAYFQNHTVNEDGDVTLDSYGRVEKQDDGSIEIIAISAEEQTRILNVAQTEASALNNALDAADNYAENAEDGGLKSLEGEGLVSGGGEPNVAINAYDDDITAIVRAVFPPLSLSEARTDPLTGNALPRGFLAVRDYSSGGIKVIDDTLRESKITYDNLGNVLKTEVYDGQSDKGQYGVTVEQIYANGKPISTDININNNPIPFEFSDVGGILGQQLGYRIAGNNAVLGIGTSAVLQTLGDNLGDVLDGLVGNQSVTNAVDDAFSTFGPELLANLKSAGIGAVSSFLTAELINVLGVDGLGGEILNTAANTVIGEIVTNIVNGVSNPLGGVVNPATIGQAIGSLLGNKLANSVVQFGSIGGQIGSAVGSSLASLALVSLAGGPVGLIGGFVAAFVGNLLGGAIGSIFGGTPRSGADAQWDENEGRFVTANAYSRKGGSQETAEALASTVTETFNGILDATGGRLENPGAIRLGNYGQRKSDFVYRPTSTRDKDAITYRVDSSKDDNAFQKITSYGIYNALTDADFQIIGGSNYIKRAVYASFEPAGVNAGNFDQAALLGNIASAQAYESYLENSAVIGAIVAAESDSVFAAETAINLARAVELGLTKRHRADWFGGFTALFEEAGTNAANVEFGFDYDPYSDQISRLTGVGDFVLGDSIDIAGQTTIEAGDGNDVIRINNVTTNTDGFEVAGGAGFIANTAGLTINGEAADGSAVSIDVAATVDAGGGNDIVHASDLGDNIFGGDGNDTLYGGRLDDWLLGGDGDDRLLAGSQAGGLGGDGNYLNGGAGDDIVQGLEGSDWLEGGEGSDTLSGGAGDDILTGGGDSYDANGERIAGDTLYGGTGDDSYLLRIGDGSDVVDDTQVILVNDTAQVDTSINFLAPFAPQAEFLETLNNQISGNFANNIIAAYESADEFAENSFTTNYVQNRYAGLLNGSIARDWTGYYTPGVSQSNGLGGGEDSVVLGQGIGIGDVRLKRSGDDANLGNDLIVQIMGVDENGDTNPTGDQFTLKDWFTDPFKRIEWLRFADGNEIRISDITSFVAGTNGDDTLIGTLGNDFLYGGDGNDQLFLLAGDDIGSGGTGMDFVAGDSGDDLIVGGSGDDAITGNAGDDVVSGDSGNDDVYGGDGNDIVTGGRGDDVLIGGAGDDIFKYSRGDGADVLIDELNGEWDIVWERNGSANGGFDGAYTVANNGEILYNGDEVVRENIGTTEEPIFRWVGRWDYDSQNEQLRRFIQDDGAVATDGANEIDGDVVEFGVGINIQDIVLQNNGDDLKLFISNDGGSSGIVSENSDSITLKDWNASNVAGSIERLAFYATGELDLTQTNLVAGSDGSDTLVGAAGVDWITAGTGDDSIDGGSGDDILSGNGGIDIIRGGDGDDVLYGGSGDDILIGGANSVNRQGDILIGGSGSDWASYQDQTDDITVSLQYAERNIGVAAGDSYVSIENLIGGSGNDSLSGDTFENILEGGSGDDILSGDLGDDTYIWNIGDGSDVIEEGQRSFEEAVSSDGIFRSDFSSEKISSYTGRMEEHDENPERVYRHTLKAYDDQEIKIYEKTIENFESHYPNNPARWPEDGWLEGYRPTDGSLQVARDTIDTSLDAGSDTIELGEGITLSDLAFEWDNNDLSIYYGTGNNRVSLTIFDQNSDGGQVETLQFYDGLSANLGGLLLSSNGDVNDNFIIGANGEDTINGNGGDDVIYGDGGNDTLSGQGGDDTIEGGVGADILSGGGDTNNSGNDTVSYRSSVGGVIVDFGATTQSGGDAQGDEISGFENFVGSSSHDEFTGDGADNQAFGGEGNDTLNGEAGDDVLVGGSGVDTIRGGSGDDNISGGEDRDFLYGGDGNDIIHTGTGSNYAYGEDGDDTIIGGNGHNWMLSGGNGDDLIIGGNVYDRLEGGNGNDQLIGGVGDDFIRGGHGDDLYLLGANDGQDTINDSSGSNIIAFANVNEDGSSALDDGITRDQIWLTQAGGDLQISVIGGDTVATVQNFFAQSATGSIERLVTSDGQLLLHHESVRDLIARMTALSSETPEIIPSEIADDLNLYWDDVNGIAPRAPETVQTINITNLGANAINVDDWPNLPSTGRGQNLVDDGGWPRDTNDIPANGVAPDGWASWVLAETEWTVTDGPYGQNIVSLHAGETDGDVGGGGARSPDITLDGSQAYEFTWYFKNDDEPDQAITFGPGYGGANPQLLRAHNGVADRYSRFLTYSAEDQKAELETGRWYKFVAYVLPEGSEDVPVGELGGIYDTVTGEKIRDVANNFRWNENRDVDTLAISAGTSRGSEIRYNTHLYQPEIREIDPLFALRDGEELNLLVDSLSFTGETEGWINHAVLQSNGESRWTYIDGPNGEEKTVLQVGQFDSQNYGGGNNSNDVIIDSDKTYRYTQYFRKSDLTKQAVEISLSASGENSHGTEVLHNGNASNGGRFLYADPNTQQQNLEEDKWYKLVGYVLPEGSANAATGTYGGVYDAQTGEKVLDVPAFRWVDDTNNTITARGNFYTRGDTDNPGWSTYFDAPTFSAIPNDTLAADNADPFGNDAQTRNASHRFFVEGVSDHDNNISEYRLNPDSLPTQGELTLIDAATGEFEYRPNADAIGEDNFSVYVLDADGNSIAVPVNINLSLGGVNSAPLTPENGFEISLDENSDTATIAGTLSTTDPDGDSGIDFRFTESFTTMVGGRYVTFSNDDRFRLERDTGNVIVQEASFDYESGQHDYNYDILVSDKNSRRNSRRTTSNLTVTIEDVNEAHSLIDVELDINHYSKALGPFIPIPDDQGQAIDLRALMLDDPEGNNVQWSIYEVTLNGNVIADHPWSVGPDGLLHLNGNVSASEKYVITIEASDSGVIGGAKSSATLTLNVGEDDGFIANPYLANSDYDNPYFNSYNYYGFSGLNFLAPIVIDLDGDGVELVSIDANVEFDIDSDGILDRTGWFGADDGLLIIDLNNDGIVNDGSEISFQRFVDGAFSDLEGLAFFDTNLNGLLDAGDTQFDEFGIWRDLNQDGITDDGELLTLTEIGLESISLNGVQTGDLPGGRDNVIYATSNYTNIDGTTGEVGDTFFVFEAGEEDVSIDPPIDQPDTGIDNPEGENSLALVNEQSFERKRKKYRLTSSGGELFIAPKNQNNVIDTRAGLIAGSTHLNFRKSEIGLLSTIILDLDGDGLETQDGRKTDALFDIDGNGTVDDTGWAGRGDGYLVVDRNGDGIINDGNELSFMSELASAGSGFQGLSVFDSNRDGIISAADDRFGELQIWVDINENGRTDIGELRSLEDHGIASFNLLANANDTTVKVGKNILLSTSTFTRTNGSTGTIGDTVLSYTPSANASINNFSNDSSINALINPSIEAPRTISPNSINEEIDLREIISNGFDPFSGPNSAENDTLASTLPAELGIEAIDDEFLIAETEEVIQSSDVDSTQEAVDSDVVKLALMVQDMSVFDANRTGELGKIIPQNNNPVDYFAA